MKVKQIKVSDICHLIVKEATVINSEATIGELFQRMIKDQRTRHVYVVNNQKKIVGSVRLNDLIEFIMCYLSNLNDDSFNIFIAEFSEKKVSDIMLKDYLFLNPETSIENMISIMIEHKVNELPVVDNNKEVVGEANFLEFIKFLSDNSPTQKFLKK